MTSAGLEPAIPSSVGRCLIHWATGPMGECSRISKTDRHTRVGAPNEHDGRSHDGAWMGGILVQAFEKYAILLLQVTALNSPETSTAVMWLCGEVEKRPLCYESS